MLIFKQPKKLDWFNFFFLWGKFT